MEYWNFKCMNIGCVVMDIGYVMDICFNFSVWEPNKMADSDGILDFRVFLQYFDSYERWKVSFKGKVVGYCD